VFLFILRIMVDVERHVIRQSERAFDTYKLTQGINDGSGPIRTGWAA
jgi:hypothetical protein